MRILLVSLAALHLPALVHTALVTLNGVSKDTALTFDGKSLGDISNSEITLANDQSFALPSSSLGFFGAGDFSVSIKTPDLHHNTFDAAMPDPNYGRLFTLSASSNADGVGPTAWFIKSTKQIGFRMLLSAQCVTANNILDGLSAGPTLLFTRSGHSLSIAINGAIVKTCLDTSAIDTTQFVGADMQFGRDHSRTGQNLALKLGPIILRTVRVLDCSP